MLQPSRACKRPSPAKSFQRESHPALPSTRESASTLSENRDSGNENEPRPRNWQFERQHPPRVVGMCQVWSRATRSQSRAAINPSRPCATWANPKRYEERTKVHKLCELGNGSWNKACSEQGRLTGGSIVSGLLTAHDAASSGKPSPFGNTWLLQLLQVMPCKTWGVCTTRIKQWGRASQERGFSA